MPQPDETLELVYKKAWDEIHHDDWSQLKWFVKLSNAPDFATKTDGEELPWTKQFQAMLTEASMPLSHVPSDEQRYPGSSLTKTSQGSVLGLPIPPNLMEKVRGSVALHLNRLADGQDTDFEHFSLHFSTRFRHVHNAYGKTEIPRYRIYRGEVGGQPHERLLLHLSKLLERYTDQIRRCPYPKCRKIFLQSRLNQEYCDRKCQSVDVMRKRRDKAKMAVKAKRQGAKPTAKGGSRHGKTKR